MKNSLLEHRQHASDLSLGLSHKMIYEKALQLVEHYSKEGKHLDFGCGQGHFLKILTESKASLNLSGIDLMKKPQDLAESIEWFVEDLNQSLKVQDNIFDSITALEIIEHLENPRHVFRELYRVLKKDGCLILSTPNNESWRAILSYMKRGHFVAFTDRDYPAHITALNRKDLLRSAQETGFKFEDWAFSGQGCVPGVTSLTWQKMSFGWLNGLRYSDNIFVVLKK